MNTYFNIPVTNRPIPTRALVPPVECDVTEITAIGSRPLISAVTLQAYIGDKGEQTCSQFFQFSCWLSWSFWWLPCRVEKDQADAIRFEPCSLASLSHQQLKLQPERKLHLAGSSRSDRSDIDRRSNLAKAFRRNVGGR